jgi:hypothetical protein
MWWLLGRDANATRYNRAGAGASVDNGEKEKTARQSNYLSCWFLKFSGMPYLCKKTEKWEL